MKHILFTGDSITDGNRYKRKEDRGDLNHQMGHSYAYVINAILGSEYPEKQLRFSNRGISGNRIIDLYGRRDEDIIQLKPDVLSIMVGINDGPLHEHAGRATKPEVYEKIYGMMLKEIKRELPDIEFVIMEPFVIPAGSRREDYNVWRNCIDNYRRISAGLAKEYHAIFVPLQEMFDQAILTNEPEYWVWDGIHPTENGHGLIARQWMDAAQSIWKGGIDECDLQNIIH